MIAGVGALIGATLLVLSFFQPHLFGGLRGAAQDGVSPATETAATVRTGSKGFWDTVSGYYRAGSKNAELKREMEIARIRLAEAEAVKQENARLKGLLDLQDELMDAMYGVQQETLRNGPASGEASVSGTHLGDAGSDAYDRDFALNLLSKEQDALQEIQAALERITEGTYGICGISGKKIPQARLEAIPFARLTVECQSQWERENPHRKFRSSDAIGFGAATTSSPAVSLDAGA